MASSWLLTDGPACGREGAKDVPPPRPVPPLELPPPPSPVPRKPLPPPPHDAAVVATAKAAKRLSGRTLIVLRLTDDMRGLIE